MNTRLHRPPFSSPSPLPLSCKQLQSWPSPIWPDMVVCDPAWLRSRPDQRQRSNLGKTFGLRMDGISVRKPFPLGSLGLGPRDRVTTPKCRHERGGDANPHTLGFLSVLYPHSTTTTNNVSLLPLHSSSSKFLSTQYLCVTPKLHPPSFSALPPLPPPQPFIPKNTQASSQRINRKP